ncbi:Hypothetical protein R9X50_00449700 [Acrodontium crateriforme]|uniref:Uncharacterized protein n=1 Tax=Acrodontium crateriforme TaxID=150365 RepID=A0AAQ3M4E5_9PEZI|nr:Hypothetical protein R9X50_00449700 [Acrodontium crateriforme]
MASPDENDAQSSGIELATAGRRPSHYDAEKASPNIALRLASLSPAQNYNDNDDENALERSQTRWYKSIKFFHHNLETRGMQRVPPQARHDSKGTTWLNISMMWFGINCAANNVTLGMLGPTVFTLSFTDSAICGVLGGIVGSIPVAYVAIFGPRSGNRTMVFSRYIMGWYPSKLIVVLTLIGLLGYCIIDGVVAGQILSAVSANGSLSIIVGIVIVAIITWFVTTFGYGAFQIYERYAWLPQLIVCCILAGVAGPKFDLTGNPSANLPWLTLAGNRLSFFSINFSAAITYTDLAADYFVYMAEDTPRRNIVLGTLAGLWASFTFMFILGNGLASGIATNPAWSDAYEVSQGALIVEALKPLGPFGSFCSVVIAIGLVANIVAPTYSAGLDFQALGRYIEPVPRVILNTVCVVIWTVCAIAGRANLAEIFTNFLALMGYWVSIWLAIVVEEHLIFRKYKKLGWDWEAWNDRSKMPFGIAAIVAFLIGWAGAILCMAQVWYIGPLSKAAFGAGGGDMGNYVGFAWTAFAYPPLRWLELTRFKR